MNEFDDQAYFVKQLTDPSTPDDAIEAAISIVQLGFFQSALHPLLAIVRDPSRPMKLRELAARAIRVIGSGPISEEIRVLKDISDQHTCDLLQKCRTL